MESEHTAKTLQIALGSYDRKELRVEKNYLQEQSPALECTCFQNGGRLLEQLRQGRQFDVVILCSQLEDMSGLEFLMNIRSMDPKPNVVLFDEGRRQNTSAICLESGDGFCYVGHAELKNLLWELYRLPGRQSQRMERKCQELYEGWGIQLPDVNCNYLSCAVGVVYGHQPEAGHPQGNPAGGERAVRCVGLCCGQRHPAYDRPAGSKALGQVAALQGRKRICGRETYHW